MTRAEIIARIEAGETGRELDAEIAQSIEPGEIVWLQPRTGTLDLYPAIKRARSNYIGGYAKEHVPHYTTSIDASESLPGEIFECGRCVQGQTGWYAHIMGPRKGSIAHAPTEAAARTAAKLKALEPKP